MTQNPEPSAASAPSATPSAAPSVAQGAGSAVDLGPVLRAVARVRLRLRAQAAARHLFYGLLVAAVGLLAGVVLFKLRVLSLPQLRAVGLGGAVAVVLLALVGALRRIEPLQVAARIDKSHKLHDRLASALEFQREARRSPKDKASEGPSGAGAMAALRRLAMQDAVRVAEGVVPAVAAPWQRPPYLLPIFILLGLAALLGLVRLPRGRSAITTGETKPAATSDAPRLVVEPELLAPEKDEILRQLAEAERQGDAATAAILREMLKLLEQAERGELTRQQAFDKLSELEQRLMEGKEGALEDLKQKLRKAGSELGESKLAKDVGQALVKEDLDKAQKELKRLAEQALQRQKGDRAQNQKDKSDLAQAMDAAARALSGKDDKAQKDLKREDQKDPSKQKDQWQDKSQAEKDRKEREELKRKLDELRAEERRLKERLEKNPNDEQAKQRLEQVQREMEETERRLKEKEEARKAEERTQRQQELRDEERRLKKKLEQNPNDEETQRQLKKTQRELEKLEQEQRERDEARRELEQLEKDMQRAAEELRNQLEKMTPEQRKALEQLQKDLSRMQDEIKKLQKQKQGRGQAQMALGSLKTVLRRIARSTMGPGGGQQGQGQGQGQQGKSGAMRDFLQRANGKGGQGEEVLVEGEGGKGGEKMLILGQGGDQTVILPGLGGQGAGQRGQGQQGQGQDGPGGGKGGDGAGTQHDPNLQGDPTQITGNRKLTKVTGKEGAGPTRSETILGAAEKGFATSSYRRVYGDYTAVSEQVMSKQRVPPGYRFYVKRYFQMIKPRDR